MVVFVAEGAQVPCDLSLKWGMVRRICGSWKTKGTEWQLLSLDQKQGPPSLTG